MTIKMPIYYLSHGGGPWPWMTEQTHGAYDELAAALAAMPDDVGVAPRAMLIISAHWEAPAFTVMTHPSPPMLYDYYNFPDYTYRVQYPAPGEPALAEEVRAHMFMFEDIVGLEDRAIQVVQNQGICFLGTSYFARPKAPILPDEVADRTFILVGSEQKAPPQGPKHSA